MNAQGTVSRRKFIGSAGAATLLAALAHPRAAWALDPSKRDPEEAKLHGTDPDRLGSYKLGSQLYANPLKSASDVSDFILEGEASVTFPNGRMRLENTLDPKLGQKSNFVFWFPKELPADFAASWEFRPLREPGLCMVFFGARARTGGDIFEPGLAKRTGEYAQYHHGDIDTLHLSYFRRKEERERAFHVCNLRKSFGFHLVAEGADPIPSAIEGASPYLIQLVKLGSEVAFFIDGLPVLEWRDDGRKYGPVLGGGRLGFRQLAPLQAEYEDFRVRDVSRSA